MKMTAKVYNDNILVLSFEGMILPENEFEFEQKIYKELKKEYEYVVVNLKKVYVVNSIFVSSLMLLAKRLSRLERELLIVEVQIPVLQLFDHFKVNRIVPILPNFTTAFKVIKKYENDSTLV